MTKIFLDREKIAARIEDIERSCRELKKYQGMNIQDFLADKDNFPLASHWLRIALEAVLTIGTHLLSRLPSNGKKKDYTQVILSLADYEVLPQDFAQKIKGMAGYRNRLVHLYWEIKPVEILTIINQELEDLDRFVDYIKRFIQRIEK